MACCLWWFLGGALLGWLGSWLLGRMFRSEATAPVAAVAAPVVRAAATVTDGIDLAKAKAAGFVLGGPDALEIIEGIGPSIANLLRSNGVGTFARLAAMSVADIQAILTGGGDRFRLANPSTWAEQAALAAANRWSELRTLQDQLDQGVRRN